MTVMGGRIESSSTFTPALSHWERGIERRQNYAGVVLVDRLRNAIDRWDPKIPTAGEEVHMIQI